MTSSVSTKNYGFTCFWEIENFALSETDNNMEIKSQIFAVNIMNKSKFHLKLMPFPNGDFGLCIFKETLPGGIITMDFSVSILTKYGWDSEYNLCNRTFTSGNSCFGIYLKDSKLFTDKNKYIPDGSLTISCHMWNDKVKKRSVQCFLRSRIKNEKTLQYFPKQYFHDLKKQSTWTIIPRFFNQDGLTDFESNAHEISEKEVMNKCTQTTTDEFRNSLNDTDDLLNFFATEKFSYVTLRTSNKEFLVHKDLLCSQSPVFCTMFDNEMLENQRNIVDIDDIGNETLSKLLQFLYQEPLDDLEWEISTKLYYAADKYHMQQLKNECRGLLKNKLTAENACELLVLSDLHQDEELKQCVQDYFCNHSKNILLTREWKDLLLSRTELAFEVLRTYAKRS